MSSLKAECTKLKSRIEFYNYIIGIKNLMNSIFCLGALNFIVTTFPKGMMKLTLSTISLSLCLLYLNKAARRKK